MYVLGIETHDAADCPGRHPEARRQMVEKLSPDAASRAGLRIIGAFMNCPEPATPGTHQGYFLVDAPDQRAVGAYFDPPVKLTTQQVWSVLEQLRQMSQ